MRENLPVTDTEQSFGDDERLISTTNQRGVITSANDTFVRVSGFSHEELEGQPHNIVRHPDMPEAVYSSFWQTLKSGSPWMGLVKNRCKNGDYYWVNAYVTPIFDDGNHVGFQSVRTKPDPDARDRAYNAYVRMNKGKRAATLGQRLGAHWLWALSTVAGVSGSVFGGVAIGSGSPLLGAGSIAAGMAASAVIAYPAFRSIMGLSRRCRAIFDDSVGELAYGGACDVIGQAHQALSMEESKIEALRGRVDDMVSELTHAADHASSAAEQGDASSSDQEGEIQQLASAMEQMSATVNEVAQNTEQASEHASQANDEAVAGKTTISNSVEAMEKLTHRVSEANESVRSLKDQTGEIRSVIEVITSIAEQTNLLALNAAIEAARAGESGRGFAVVADEVRQLSHRVSDSTKQIGETIEQLERRAESTAEIMEQSHRFSDEVKDTARQSNSAMESIEGAIGQIRSMADQIATATQQQSQTASDISYRVSLIHGNAQQNAQTAHDTKATSDHLQSMARNLKDVIRQFR